MSCTDEEDFKGPVVDEVMHHWRNAPSILEGLSMLVSQNCATSKDDETVRSDENKVNILEFGAGMAPHAVFICKHHPDWSWQATDLDTKTMTPFVQRARGGLPDGYSATNLKDPIVLDVNDLKQWEQIESKPKDGFDVVFTSCTLMVMSWNTVCAAFQGAASVLRPGGLLCAYGPFNVKGEFTSEGNKEFDNFLRGTAENSPPWAKPELGLRDIVDLTKIAESNQFVIPFGTEGEPNYSASMLPMPENNFIVWFKKKY